MRLRLDIILEEIIAKYRLCNLVDKEGWVYVEILKGMYDLPQAGILANQLLEKRLVSTKGYYQCQHTPGLWRHVWRSIVFCLVVDNFGIKVTHMDDMHHLKTALGEHYTVTAGKDRYSVVSNSPGISSIDTVRISTHGYL